MNFHLSYSLLTMSTTTWRVICLTCSYWLYMRCTWLQLEIKKDSRGARVDPGLQDGQRTRNREEINKIHTLMSLWFTTTLRLPTLTPPCSRQISCERCQPPQSPQGLANSLPTLASHRKALPTPCQSPQPHHANLTQYPPALGKHCLTYITPYGLH